MSSRDLLSQDLEQGSPANARRYHWQRDRHHPNRVKPLLLSMETTEKVRRLGGLFPSGLIRSFFPANQWF
jgi:hypothetical protein